MWTITLLIYLSYLSLGLAAIIILLLGTSFSRRERNRFPILTKLDGKQLRFGCAAVLLLALGYALSAYRDVFVIRQSFRQQQGPGTSQALIATQDAFDLELLDAAADAVRGARVHFQAAQGLFTARNYAGAVPEYRASVAALPTLSAYLNLGISLRWLSDFQEAARVLEAGLKLSRERRRELFEAHFLFQLGSVQNFLGVQNQATANLSEAVRRYHELHDAAGEANASLNLSLLYRNIGRTEDGQHLFNRARELYQRTGDKLGLANIAHNEAYYQMHQENLEGALVSYRKALARYMEIGHKMGETNTRIAIGTCLLNLGRIGEAEKELRTARDVAKASGSKVLEINADVGLGQVLVREDKLADSVKFSSEALLLAREAHSSFGEADSLLTLANGLARGVTLLQVYQK